MRYLIFLGTLLLSLCHFSSNSYGSETESAPLLIKWNLWNTKEQDAIEVLVNRLSMFEDYLENRKITEEDEKQHLTESQQKRRAIVKKTNNLTLKSIRAFTAKLI